MIKSISLAENRYIEQGCRFGIRQDGRGLLDFRNIYIENNILPQANGSSRVKISEGTDILCSVKVEVSSISSDKVNRGKLEVSTEISPSCNIKVDDRKLVSSARQISETIESFLVDSESIDFPNLCIIPGKYVWVILVDIMILQCDGDPIDACSIAVYTALSSTHIPKIENIIGETGKNDDFEISGDLADAIRLPFTHLPISITVSKIGGCLVLDCNGSEVACATSLLVIALDITGRCYGITKLLGGSFSPEEYQNALKLAIDAVKVKLPRIESFFSSQNSVFSKDLLFPEIPHVRMGYLA